MFVFGASDAKNRVIQANYGPCNVESCDGAVSLIENSVSSSLWFIPMGTATNELVVCQKCGWSIKSQYYKLQRQYGAGIGLQPLSQQQQEETSAQPSTEQTAATVEATIASTDLSPNNEVSETMAVAVDSAVSSTNSQMKEAQVLYVHEADDKANATS